jgi:serine/threonine protein kinase
MERQERDLRGEIVDGRFRVEEKLGSGGMGTVWRVQHVVSLQRLALKTLDPTYAKEEEATQRFLREARSAAALKTRHVVRIIDAQMHHQHDGAPLPFLVMELLEGKNLQQIIDERGRLPAPEMIWVSGQLARALDVAHRQGIVHRDLKPSNVFIATDEEGHPIVKLCDFGIAKLTGDATALANDDTSMPTRTGAMLGTPMYLAPELLRGSGSAVPATDQWSMGLVCFRALAGVEYFAHVRGFSDLVLTIANDPLVPPSQKVSGLPRAFDAWFLRSCARRPEERFADVPAQAAALAEALGRPAATPIQIHSASPPALAATAASDDLPLRAAAAGEGAGRPARRSRRKLYLAVASAWAVCALGAFGWLGTRRQADVQATVAPAPVAATAHEQTQPAPPPPPPIPQPTPPSTSTSPSTDTKTNAPANANTPANTNTNTPANKPAPASEPAPVHRRHKAAAARPPATAKATSKPAALLPKGAACQRSAECASGLCAAETCL